MLLRLLRKKGETQFDRRARREPSKPRSRLHLDAAQCGVSTPNRQRATSDLPAPTSPARPTTSPRRTSMECFQRRPASGRGPRGSSRRVAIPAPPALTDGRRHQCDDLLLAQFGGGLGADTFAVPNDRDKVAETKTSSSRCETYNIPRPSPPETSANRRSASALLNEVVGSSRTEEPGSEGEGPGDLDKLLLADRQGLDQRIDGKVQADGRPGSPSRWSSLDRNRFGLRGAASGRERMFSAMVIRGTSLKLLMDDRDACVASGKKRSAKMHRLAEHPQFALRPARPDLRSS